MIEKKQAKSKAPAPDTKSWHDYMLKTRQETPMRLEDAAKFLATMISLSLTLFLAIGKTAFESTAVTPALKAAVALWLLAALAAFAVMFPGKYHYVSQSAQSIKAAHQKIITTKKTLLFISLGLYLIALAILSWVFFRAG